VKFSVTKINTKIFDPHEMMRPHIVWSVGSAVTSLERQRTY